MSRRVGKGMRNKDEKQEKRPPPSHIALGAIQSMTNVMMCSSCKMKMLCPSFMQCRMEAILESKVAILSKRMGEDNIKKLTHPELLMKMREISDEDAIKFLGGGVLDNVSMDKESVREGTEDGGGEEGNKAGDIQDDTQTNESVGSEVKLSPSDSEDDQNGEED